LSNYYHALDFKKFEDAYEYLDPETRPSKEQYFMELSLEDGIMASYSKLTDLKYEFKQVDEENINVKVKSNWLTSIQNYQEDKKLELVKRSDKWFVKHESYELITPPDQLVKVAELDVKQQGRRKAKVNETRQEDILDRPEIFIDEASLIRKDSSLSVVGHLTNIDNDPAYITVEVVLYDQQGNEKKRSTVGTKMVHNLLPKESSVFQADFAFDSIDEELDFAVFVRSVVYDRFMYKYFGITDFKLEGQQVSGEMVNNGSREISIPHILIPSYKSNRICYIDEYYLPKGIRPQRSKDFNFEREDISSLEILKSARLDQFIVNGIPCVESQKKLPAMNEHAILFLDGYVPDKQ